MQSHWTTFVSKETRYTREPVLHLPILGSYYAGFVRVDLTQARIIERHLDGLIDFIARRESSYQVVTRTGETVLSEITTISLSRPEVMTIIAFADVIRAYSENAPYFVPPRDSRIDTDENYPSIALEKAADLLNEMSEHNFMMFMHRVRQQRREAGKEDNDYA